MKSFIIRRRMPMRYWMFLLGMCVLLLLILMFGNRYGKPGAWNLWLPWSAGRELPVEELRGPNAELQEKLLILEQNGRVDKQAAVLLQQQLVDTQKENFRLRKDLEFYQGIIHVQNDRTSPVIHGIRIKPLVRAREYRLELILLHITNRDKVLEGNLDVVLEGVESSSAAMRLPLKEISLSRNPAYSVRFRNFQRVENSFVLPEDFQPQKIFVTVTIDGDERSGFEKIFDWPLTENGEIADVG